VAKLRAKARNGFFDSTRLNRISCLSGGWLAFRKTKATTRFVWTPLADDRERMISFRPEKTEGSDAFIAGSKNSTSRRVGPTEDQIQHLLKGGWP